MPIDPKSQTWKAVRDEAETSIKAAAQKLEIGGRGLPQTEFDRGYIRAWREVLAMAETPVDIPSSDPGYLPE